MLIEKETVDPEVSEKFYRLLELLDYIDFDLKTKTIIFKGDIKFKVEGNYELETDKHILLMSNKEEWDSEKNIPFSIMMNCSQNK